MTRTKTHYDQITTIFGEAGITFRESDEFGKLKLIVKSAEADTDDAVMVFDSSKRLLEVYGLGRWTD